MNFLVSVGTAEMERTPATEEFWAAYKAAAKLTVSASAIETRCCSSAEAVASALSTRW